MGTLVLWLQQHIHEHSLWYFIALYILGGKPVAILTAKLYGLNFALLFPLLLVMDAVQIPCFYYLYGCMFREERLRRVTHYLQRKGDAAKAGYLFPILEGLGPLGVLLLTMLPVKGGGIWSGVLLARLLGLPMNISFPLLLGGSILISLILIGVGDGLIGVWHMISQ